MKIFAIAVIFIFSLCIASASGGGSVFGAVPSVSRKEAQAISEAQKSETDAAIGVLESAAKSEWAGSAIFFNLANLYANSGNLEKAEANYRLALEKLPSFFMAQKNLAIVLSESSGKSEAFSEMKKALALSGGSDPDILLWMASHHMEGGDYSEALFCCNQALVYDYQNARARLVKARLLLKLNMLEECRSVCLSLLSKDLRNFDALETLTACRAKAGDYGGAVSAAEIARALGEEDSQTLKIGDLYFSAGLYSEAAKEYAANAGTGDLKKSLKNALLALIACGKYSDAKKLAPKLGLPDAKMVSAQALAAEGKKSEAIAEYGAYFDSGGRDAKAHFEYAGLLLESGDAIQAGAHFDAASEDSKYALASLYGKMRVAVSMSDFRQALKTAKKIQSIKKSDEIEIYIKHLNELDKPSQ